MRLAVIFGGVSYEHEISIVSAIALKNVLKTDLDFIFCDKFRNFYLIDKKDMKANFFSSKKYQKSKQLELKNGGFFTKSIMSKKLDITCVINLIHGCDGEDGKIAALFDFFDINYIGPRLEASVLSFSKELTKLYAKKVGVNVLPYEVIKRGEMPTFELPIILKPLRLGSSIGVSMVHDKSDLEYALDVAFEFDDEVLVEPLIENVREFNLAGCKIEDKIVHSIVEEPKKEKMLDFEQKYMSFSNENRSKKADITLELENEFKATFDKIYNTTFDGALIRCDFFYHEGKIYLNEINPNPGSLANYLFNDFENIILKLAKNTPKSKQIDIDYKFINSITSAKDKL
ncbi:D-alanyl-alanine synthetase A [Campylobacter sputorum subsp. bubulus]|uniref:D-alanine--D-alanine ligase n=1 Tax=Campylobacter sputorum subsp. sputorum TaxID=32024 RepID=A0A381DJT7_9BACT|nr:D-alanine--D-alanine ligase [Campylobacter sputorum]ASM34293.1 D-alanine--D-alanine ligase [Campylobacter sputorum aubsp. sputorum RM3237]KAB0582314.1 D-alanine--D-alanine ligase [Campylobacter sputorum subsp. sputorum]QEL04484.1 D-alanine--D-alanine ligase [Campylobacter sputorum subsp. sputorum]SUX09258.1 D-alanyl-alanine synthetase A [Campylobacter sputorum subsp. bubulus]SUX10949.1 D-alanyl-alanine synthetase A [Campylobacter sputorum subsp. sputorum]